MQEIVLKRCEICGAIVRVVKDGPVMCCGRSMEKVECNAKDYSFEKHLPNVQKENDKIIVRVPHVMDEGHYIKWICMVTEDGEYLKKLNPGNEASVVFPYVSGSTIYSYCNIHGLWKKEVE